MHLADEYLEGHVQIATTEFTTNIDMLTTQEQRQTSHDLIISF
jgi:hypothetical protein